MRPVTDPALVAQLEAGQPNNQLKPVTDQSAVAVLDGAPSALKPVTDPSTLAVLDGPEMMAAPEPTFTGSLADAFQTLIGGNGDDRPRIERLHDSIGQVLDAITPDAFQRGLRRGEQGMLAATGGLMPETVYGPEADQMANAVQIGAIEREAQRYPQDPARQEALQRIVQAPDMLTAASEVVSNPGAIGDVALESMGVAAPQLAATGLAGLFGGAPATAAASGAGSFSTEYGQTVLQAVQEAAGGDLRDSLAVGRALSDPKIMEVARERAVRRGVPIAVFDALTAGVAGQVMRIARTVPQAVAAAGGEVGVQAAGGMAGEATAQLADKGEVTSPGDILLEGVAEVPTAVVEAPVNVLHARANAQPAGLKPVTDPALVAELEGAKAAPEATNAAPQQTATPAPQVAQPAPASGRPVAVGSGTNPGAAPVPVAGNDGASGPEVTGGRVQPAAPVAAVQPEPAAALTPAGAVPPLQVPPSEGVQTPTQPAAAVAPAPVSSSITIAPPEVAPDVAAKRARLKVIRSEQEPLANKGGLTADEAKRFRELNAEARGLRYELTKPLATEKVKPEAERQSTLPADVVVTAHQDLMRNRAVYDRIGEAAEGVGFNEDTAVDRVMSGQDNAVTATQLYEAFAATRAALKQKFGQTMQLYRAVGKQKGKATTNWATTEAYARQFGDNVVSRDVDIDDIIAVNVGPSGNYHEMIVGKRPQAAEESRQLMPKVAEQETTDDGRDLPATGRSEDDEDSLLEKSPEDQQEGSERSGAEEDGENAAPTIDPDEPLVSSAGEALRNLPPLPKDAGGKVNPDDILDGLLGIDRKKQKLFGLFDKEPLANQPGKRTSAEIRRVSFTNRPSNFADAAVEAGYEPDNFNLLPASKQFEVLANLARDKFGFSLIERTKRMNSIEGVDQLLDMYRNLQFMAHTLGLPTKAIGLKGKLAMLLRRDSEGYLGAYFPKGTPRMEGRPADPGQATIVLPKRSNSFAHEWGHALDFSILSQLTDDQFAGVSGMIRKKGADFEPSNVSEAFVRLMDNLFFDQAALAKRIMDAELAVQQAKTDKQLEAAQKKLDALTKGNAQVGKDTSEFKKQSADFQPGGAGYFNKPTEMLARSFEAYIAHKVEQAGGSVEAIAKGDFAYLSDADRQLAMVYPKGDERARIFAAYDALFDQLAKSALVEQGVAAAAPGNPELMDPAQWDRQAAKAKTGSWLSRAIEHEKQAIRAELQQAKNESERPKNPQPLSRRIENAVSYALYSKSAVFNTLEARYKGTPAGAIVRQLREKLATDPGRNRAIGAVFGEAVDRGTKKYLNRLANIQDATGATGFSKAELIQLDDVLRGSLDSKMATPAVRQAAAGMRSVLKDLYYYLDNAGVKLGYADNYLPRQLDMPVVMDAQPEFVEQATKVYRQVFDNEYKDADTILETPELLGNFLKLARMSDQPQLRQLVKGLKKIRDLKENKAEQAKIDEATTAAEQLIAEMYPSVRDFFADYSARAWLANIVESGFYGMERHGPENNFTKSRVLPKEADKLMQKFYVNDPNESVAMYIMRAVRRAEFARRFGADGKQLDDMFEAMQRAGMPAADVELLKANVEPMLGRLNSRMPRGAQSFINYLHAFGTMVLLTRSAISSIGEPVVASIRSGNVADVFKAYVNQLKLAVGTKDAEEWRNVARALGVVSNSLADTIVANRAGGTYLDSPKTDKMLGKYFRRVFLHQLTNAQRTSTLPIAFEFIRQQTAAAVGKNPAKAAKGKIMLAELGIRADDIKDFADWLLASDSMVSIEELRGSRNGEIMGDAMARFVDQVIQNPQGYDRPALANSPAGRLMYSILSFSMAFWNNVIKRQINLTRTLGKEVGVGAAAGNAMTALAGLASLYMVQTLVSTAREAIFNPNRWDELKKKGELEKTMLQLGFTRAFPLGLADPVIQAFTGLKYQRDISNIFIGNIPAYFAQALQNALTPLVRNSPKTNAAEFRSAQGVYQLLVAPALVYGLARLPGGPLLEAAYGLGMATATSPAARDTAAELAVGPKDEDKKKGFAALK